LNSPDAGYDPFAALPWALGGFTRIYEDHHRALLRVAFRVVHDRSIAEDVVHDVLTDLWRRPWRYEPARGSLSAYLSCVTNGRAIDTLRGNTSRRNREARVGRMATQHHAAGEDEYIEQWDKIEISSRLRASAGKLSPKCREAISAAFGDTHTYCANAARLGIPEGTFKSRVRDGLTEMRQHLRQPVLDDEALQ
jgi:RNA polymerase sigma-70 factor (ECF subfamily)